MVYKIQKRKCKKQSLNKIQFSFTQQTNIIHIILYRVYSCRMCVRVCVYLYFYLCLREVVLWQGMKVFFGICVSTVCVCVCLGNYTVDLRV